MNDLRFDVRSCIQHERLAWELLELTTRAQYLSRFRRLSREEQAALARLVDHELKHGSGR